MVIRGGSCWRGSGGRAASIGSALALAALAGGCGADRAEPTPDAGGTPCPECQVAGGETSDFGSIAQPTPCEKSEASEVIDEAAARELGFGEALELFTRSFESALKWTANLDPSWRPASGYAANTSVRIKTRPTRLEHRIPALESCQDRLLVTLDVSFASADGALSVSGQALANTGRAPASSAFGRLDLSSARGSLMLFPPSIVPAPRVGYLAVGLNFWPDMVRGFVFVEVMQAGTEDNDVRAGYRPLDGKFPIDDCLQFQRPLTPDQPSTTLSGRSSIDFRDELMARLTAQQPVQGTWKNNATTMVTTELGVPTSVCESPSSIGYSVPLKVTSSDARVTIDGVARAYAGFDDAGALRDAWLEIYDSEPVSSPEFAAHSGISGVDLAGLGGAFWHTELYLQNSDARPARGSVTVEGVDVQGTITGVPFAVTGVVEELTWPLK